MNLRELLDDWEDEDISGYYLACCLGFLSYDSSFTVFREAKHIFWTDNPTSRFLYEMLQKMAEIQMLEFDDDKSQYRWNKAFQ